MMMSEQHWQILGPLIKFSLLSCFCTECELAGFPNFKWRGGKLYQEYYFVIYENYVKLKKFLYP